MNQQSIIPHLFRTEFSKITAVLCRHFGVGHMQIAEDIASETFLAALETWPFRGLPENPEAWLFTVAGNKARNYIYRQQILNDKVVPQILHHLPDHHSTDLDLSDKNIMDSQLQMFFVVCHPCISQEAQVALALRILCGFGIDEIANAFLCSKDTINKRLFRAKEKLRLHKASFDYPPEPEIGKRLNTVLTTMYLLFNEGYYSESRDMILRKDLCLEAMRLCHLLLAHTLTNRPPVKALLALMCFHASRFDARISDSGEMILYHDQDESLWNRDLISKGARYLHQASIGDSVSRYHLEAAIAYWHTQKENSAEKWNNIFQLYNLLLGSWHSPIAALNRIYALSQIAGKQAAITEAEKLQFTTNPYYFTLLGELYTGVDDLKAKLNYQKALHLAKTHADKKIIEKKLRLF